ncbi:energy transducer TonB [Sphingobium amiense]|uniref:Energy transducer TonB n=1 Tax=Sphingobium amiense TaxID=135719 RepID=A0A494W1Q4_9SPHN|nr:energy transducer TonB [Sphingobium amiense]BBD98544.1 energy transducer TonB [Sphingobium amiense]
MLQAASRAFDDDRSDLFDQPQPAARSHAAPAALPVAPARYGSQSRLNLPVILAIVLVHGLLLALFLQIRNEVQRRQEAKLTVVNLTPPPPPPAAADTPPPAQPQVAAPPPLVQTPVTSAPQVQTAPAPVAFAPPTIVAPPSPAPAAAPAAAPAPPAIVQASDLGTQMLSGKPPRYPIESRRRREQGTVALALVLSLDGSVESISIAQSSGFPRLDDAARDAVKGWRWKPTLRGGQPVRVRGTVEIPFVLKTGAA